MLLYWRLLFCNIEVKEAIFRRRSVRNYLERKVSKELILELIDAARKAPSGNNAQPWKFFVVTDLKTKAKFFKENVFP